MSEHIAKFVYDVAADRELEHRLDSGELSDGELELVVGGLNPQPLPPGGMVATSSWSFMSLFASRGIIVIGG